MRKAQHKQNHLLVVILVGIIALLIIAVLALLFSRQPATPQTQPQPINNTRTKALNKLSTDYQTCIQEGDKSYQEALAKIPEGTDSTTRWNYIQSLQQTVDSHKANCDRIYQTEKDKLNTGGQQ